MFKKGDKIVVIKDPEMQQLGWRGVVTDTNADAMYPILVKWNKEYDKVFIIGRHTRHWALDEVRLDKEHNIKRLLDKVDEQV